MQMVMGKDCRMISLGSSVLESEPLYVCAEDGNNHRKKKKKKTPSP